MGLLVPRQWAQTTATMQPAVAGESLASGTEPDDGMLTIRKSVEEVNLIFTATDKKVYALALKDGEPKWLYEAKAPFFGGVAVAGDMVYAADLNGVLHAIGAADGKGKWKLDVGRETKAPGNIYGSPVVDGGKIYLGTCNLDAADARKTVIVCIGER